MRDSFDHNVSDRINYRIVIVTLDSHNARPVSYTHLRAHETGA